MYYYYKYCIICSVHPVHVTFLCTCTTRWILVSSDFTCDFSEILSQSRCLGQSELRTRVLMFVIVNLLDALCLMIVNLLHVQSLFFPKKPWAEEGPTNSQIWKSVTIEYRHGTQIYKASFIKQTSMKSLKKKKQMKIVINMNSAFLNIMNI